MRRCLFPLPIANTKRKIQNDKWKLFSFRTKVKKLPGRMWRQRRVWCKCHWIAESKRTKTERSLACSRLALENRPISSSGILPFALERNLHETDEMASFYWPNLFHVPVVTKQDAYRPWFVTERKEKTERWQNNCFLASTKKTLSYCVFWLWIRFV